MLLVALVGAALSFSAQAQDAGSSAYEVVEDSTNRIMAIVEGAESYVDEDPERYYSELQTVLDEVVDFAGFSRAVMGPYASSKRYKSLDSAGKKALRRQVEDFTDVMRISLVRTYGKGLIAFGGSKTEVQRPDAKAEDPRKMAITQLIYNETAEPYVIQYQMRRGKDGQWKLRNLIVETINLGVIYRNQFQAAAKDYEGDIDAVIANWTTPEEADTLGS